MIPYELTITKRYMSRHATRAPILLLYPHAFLQHIEACNIILIHMLCSSNRALMIGKHHLVHDSASSETSHIHNVMSHSIDAKSYHADERRARGVGDGFRHHGLARPRRPVHENASGGINANLLVQLEVRQRKLHRLLDLPTSQVGGQWKKSNNKTTKVHTSATWRIRKIAAHSTTHTHTPVRYTPSRFVHAQQPASVDQQPRAIAPTVPPSRFGVRPTNLLFLHVHAADIVVRHVRPLLHQLNRRVALRRQNLNDTVAVPVQRHRRVGLKNLAVQGAQDAHEVVRARRRPY